MKRGLVALSLLLTTSCVVVEAHPHDAENMRPPPGSNMMLRGPITISDGLEVIISDVVIPPGAAVPRHYHPGEEFVYVIEGSAVHIEAGKADQILRAGDAYVIPPEAEHAPRGGPDGARAIVFRVHKQGLPERINMSDTGPIPDVDDLNRQMDAADIETLRTKIGNRPDAHCHAMASRAVMCHVADDRELYAFTEAGAPAHPSVLYRGFVADEKGASYLKQIGWTAADTDAAEGFFKSVRMWPETGGTD